MVPLVVALSLLLVGCAAAPTATDRRLEESVSIYTQLGVGYMQEGNYALALDKLNRALKLDSDNADANSAIAVLYERLGENERAEKHYRISVNQKGQISGALNNYGGFLCRQGRVDEAEERFIAAASDPLYPSPWIAYTNAGNCALGENDTAKAERYFRRALQAGSRFAPALYPMAKLMFDAGDFLRARAYLQRYQEVASHTAQSLWLGVQIERRLGDRNAAGSYAQLLKNTFTDSEETGMLLELERNESDRQP
ncbi:MAG: type IV pilus biogenesis/stability protein PilW [Chromatiales bacterium]|nr:type IV pilus biogenesis/stability protein PilW [Chromatiales bacterium]